VEVLLQTMSVQLSVGTVGFEVQICVMMGTQLQETDVQLLVLLKLDGFAIQNQAFVIKLLFQLLSQLISMMECLPQLGMKLCS